MARKQKPKQQAAASRETGEEPLELGYCPRCGTLQVRPASAPSKLCGACARLLRWIYGEVSDEAADL
jgi:hypothetical protein